MDHAAICRRVYPLTASACISLRIALAAWAGSICGWWKLPNSRRSEAFNFGGQVFPSWLFARCKHSLRAINPGPFQELGQDFAPSGAVVGFGHPGIFLPNGLG